SIRPAVRPRPGRRAWSSSLFSRWRACWPSRRCGCSWSTRIFRRGCQTCAWKAYLWATPESTSICAAGTTVRPNTAGAPKAACAVAHQRRQAEDALPAVALDIGPRLGEVTADAGQRRGDGHPGRRPVRVREAECDERRDHGEAQRIGEDAEQRRLQAEVVGG